MGDFRFVINATWWAVCDKDVDLRVVGENLPGFLLRIHDGEWVGFVANAALEAGEGFAAELPGGAVEV